MGLTFLNGFYMAVFSFAFLPLYVAEKRKKRLLIEDLHRLYWPWVLTQGDINIYNIGKLSGNNT